MEYKYILSPEVTNAGKVGKWYHGRFYPKPKVETAKTPLAAEKQAIKEEMQTPVKPDNPQTNKTQKGYFRK